MISRFIKSSILRSIIFLQFKRNLSAGDANVVQMDSRILGTTPYQINNYSRFGTAINQIISVDFGTASVHIEPCDTVNLPVAALNLVADLLKDSETPETIAEIAIFFSLINRTFLTIAYQRRAKNTQTAFFLLNYNEINSDVKEDKDSPVVSKNKTKIDKYNRKLMKRLTSMLSSLDE